MYMQTNKLIMVKEDFNALSNYIGKIRNSASFMEGASLLGNVEQAEIIEEEEFPWEVIRLNTRVVIRDKEARYNFTYTVVLPEEADHRKCKVSVLSPIGSALFGYRRGDDTFWLTPTGKRYFTIMAVAHKKH